MIAYAQSLAGQFKETEGVSDVSDDGIRSTTINDTLVKYIAVSFDYTQDGERYQVVNITSWTKAPDAQGFLLVEISEYNADTDAEMIDAKDELDYAYRTVNEYTEKSERSRGLNETPATFKYKRKGHLLSQVSLAQKEGFEPSRRY